MTSRQRQLENILKLLRRGEYKLSGEEALAFSQAFQFVGQLIRDEMDIKDKPDPRQPGLTEPPLPPETKKKSKLKE